MPSLLVYAMQSDRSPERSIAKLHRAVHRAIDVEMEGGLIRQRAIERVLPCIVAAVAGAHQDFNVGKRAIVPIFLARGRPPVAASRIMSDRSGLGQDG